MNNLFFIFGGIFALGLGADIIVRSSINLAKLYRVSGYFIGFTVIALGTSLPEFAATLQALNVVNSLGIALGNIIGSNIFNLLAVIGLGTAISPAFLQEDIFNIHLMLMFSLTLFIFFITFRKNDVISRPEGFLLLLTFLSYMGYIILTN